MIPSRDTDYGLASEWLSEMERLCERAARAGIVYVVDASSGKISARVIDAPPAAPRLAYLTYARGTGE